MSNVWEQAAPPTLRALADEHLALLAQESKISEDVILGRGYYTLTRQMVEQLVQLEAVHPAILRGDSWLGIPIVRPDGVIHGEIIRVFGSQARMKYVWPSGTRNAIDVHPEALPSVIDTSVPIILTEGIKKADAIYSAAKAEGITCVALAINGCWGWKAKVDGGGTIALPDFMDVPLQDRKVYIVPDSDYRTNDDVRAGWNACATYLASKTGEHRTNLVVVPSAGFAKQGADDFLAAGGTLADLLALASSPRQAILDDQTGAFPLVIKTGRQVIDEAVDEIPHLVYPIIPERSVVVLAGHSGTFKTWHALGLMLDGAFGLPWLGHPDFRMRADPFSTLYVNKEMGGMMLGDRLKKLTRHERYAKRSDYDSVLVERVFTTDEASLDLAQASQRDRLEEAIRAFKVELVVLDSLSMCWTGDENSNSEVGAFIGQLRGITERTGSSWLILHHLLKDSGGGKSKAPSKFAIRGAGQILQQSDSALLLSPFNEESGDPDARDVAITSVKTRTDREPPAFVSQFANRDGILFDLTYQGKVSEEAARAYTKSNGDPKKFAEWITSELVNMPAMRPDGPGLRSKQLMVLLQQAWPISDKQPPSDQTIYRRLGDMVAAGELELLDESRKHGHLYRLRAEAPAVGSGGGAVAPAAPALAPPKAP